MSDKAIIATDMPESCDKCKFMYEFYGVKKCQLLNVLKNGGKAIICVDKLNVARKECCPLTSSQEHDKEIRNKVIDEFTKMEDYLMDKIKEEIVDVNIDFEWRKVVCLDDIGTKLREGLREIAEKMKEVGE